MFSICAPGYHNRTTSKHYIEAAEQAGKGTAAQAHSTQKGTSIQRAFERKGSELFYLFTWKSLQNDVSQEEKIHYGPYARTWIKVDPGSTSFGSRKLL